MADSDIPARIELLKLKTLVNLLAMTVAQQGSQIAILTQGSAVLVIEDLTALSVTDTHRADVMLLKHDINQNFGIYFPADTVQPVNGTTFVADAVGTLWELFQ